MNISEGGNLIGNCPHCGEPLSFTQGYQMGYFGLMGGYEYRSQKELFGWPLIQIAFGINPGTGLPRVARGVIAVGNFSVGLVAIGGFALGGLTIAGIGMGVFVLAGIALGGVAAGGIAIGYQFALGGLAISARYATWWIGISSLGLS